MKFHITDLWRTSGKAGRATYALVGFIGFAIKHNLDRLVAFLIFHRPWDLFNYWMPLGQAVRISSLSHDDARFLATMVALALPFVWVGVAMTMKRLRSAGLPASLVLLFFLPYLNLLFFLILCLLPEREASLSTNLPSGERESFLQHLLPASALGSAAIAVMLTAPIGVSLVWLGADVLNSYGWGIFVALPFAMGFASVLVYGGQQQRGVGSCIGVACLSVALLGLGLLALAVEGAVCLAMAAPLTLALAILGGYFGYLIQRRHWRHRAAPAVLSALFLFVPGTEWVEHVAPPTPPVYMVRTAVDIQAPPEAVWKEVVAFSEIPPPREWMFRAGIAYPIKAEIEGTGPGAVRHCVFSTGAFVEPIEIWDEPRLLKFSVTSNPAPMEEWTPYGHIETPHLHGFLVSSGGQFLLTPLPNGGTRLEGTTWYRHSLWPATYWRIWSDAIIHRIHLRVLNHIRVEAEGRLDSWGDR